MNTTRLLVAISVALLSKPTLLKAQNAAPTKDSDYCKVLVNAMQTSFANIQSGKVAIAGGKDAAAQSIFLNQVATFVNAPSCFIQANQSNPDALRAIAPVRTSLWNAFQSLDGSQQQGSSLSSSGSTNAVSKPSGPTALAEEFGGANVVTGTSSLTVQWSPGTMFTNLAVTGVDYLCLNQNVPKGCISPRFLENLAPLTFKITANTSNGSPSISGTGASTGTTSASQPVAVNSQGTSGPSFTGITLQYSFFGSKSRAAAKALVTQNPEGAQTSAPSPIVQQYVNELKLADQTTRDLQNCDAYQAWSSNEANELEPQIGSSLAGATPEQMSGLQGQIELEYRALLSGMLSSPVCKLAVQDFSALFGAILEAKTYEDFEAQQNTSGKPEFALEYDLNTPQNQPSYSTAKFSLTSSFGKSKKQVPLKPNQHQTDEISEQQKNPASNGGQSILSAGQQDIRTYVKEQTAVVTSSPPGGTPQTIQQATANAKQSAQNNVKPWTLTLNGVVDIYNTHPPSSVPSGTHLRDIQAGAEIAYLFTPSSNSGALRKFIGGVTTAAAYSYQDQTSPAILTGPALTDFTDLPSSTTSAYAQRGVIHLGQVRLGFGTGSNLTYPVAFTYSNRTELVLHPTWRLQFGVTYNLTSLFSSSGTTKSTASQ